MGLFLAGSTVLHPLIRESKFAHASSYMYGYEGSEAALVRFTTDPKRIRKMVPKPFQANDKGIMTASFVHERKVKPLHSAHEYLRAVLAIPVVYEGMGVSMKGLFIEQMYNDDANSVNYGKWNWGYPSEHANITFAADQSSIKSTVTKDGIQIGRIDLSLSGTESKPEPGKDVIHFNAQRDPVSPMPTMTKTREVERERFTGQVVQAELFGVEVDQVIGAFYGKYDWYLAPQCEVLTE